MFGKIESFGRSGVGICAAANSESVTYPAVATQWAVGEERAVRDKSGEHEREDQSAA